MVHQELQDVIEQLSVNEDFRKSLVSNSERIQPTYGMTENGMVAIKSIDAIGIEKEELRPVAYCCTCYAAE